MGEKPPQADLGVDPGPQTFRDIAGQALVRLPKLCGKDDSDLALIGTTRKTLVEEIATKLAKTSVKHLKDDPTPAAVDDTVDPIILKRFGKAVGEVNQVAREVAGQIRRPAMEEAARRVLQQEDALSPEEADAAVAAIPRGQRRSIPESSERTFEGCVEEFLAQCRAHLSRARGEQAQWDASVPENEAPLRGQNMHDDFIRAVDPVVGDAEIAEVVGRALAGLPALERRVKTASVLESQLASRTLLRGGQSVQLEAEATLRAHFPFGLVSGRSHVALAAALYLLQAQTNDVVIHSIDPAQDRASTLRERRVKVRNAISRALMSQRKDEEERGWHSQYRAVAGSLDCLRVAAPTLEQSQVPAFLDVRSRGDAERDHADQIVSAALPLQERTYGDDTVPWTEARWNPLGTRLIKRANKQHYSLRNERYFSEPLFEEVITGLIEYTLEDFVKRLQRAEGVKAGLPNRKSSYTHRSLLSLNKLLTRIWDRESGKRFKALSDKVKEWTPPEEQSRVRQEPWEGPRLDVPKGAAFLTVDSVRAKLQELLTTTEPYAWEGNQLDERPNITDWEARSAAFDAIQMIDWVRAKASDLRAKGLGEVLTAFHTDSAELGNQPIPPHRADLMHELVIDILLTDETTAPILTNLASSIDRIATTAKTSEDPI